jgi:small conductance mechanosensitive channel
MKVLKELATQVRKEEAFKDVLIADPDIPGVDKISGYEVIYPINVRVMVNQRDGVLRELRRRILLAFAKEGLAFGSTSSTLILQNPGPANPPKPPVPLSTRPQ